MIAGSKIVNADGYSGTVGQRDGECRPTINLARGFSCLTLEAASYPHLVQAYIPTHLEEAFRYFECACDTEVARGIGVTYVHDPRSGQGWHINTDGVIEGRSAPVAIGAIRSRGGSDRFLDE